MHAWPHVGISRHWMADIRPTSIFENNNSCSKRYNFNPRSMSSSFAIRCVVSFEVCQSFTQYIEIRVYVYIDVYRCIYICIYIYIYIYIYDWGNLTSWRPPKRTLNLFTLSHDEKTGTKLILARTKINLVPVWTPKKSTKLILARAKINLVLFGWRREVLNLSSLEPK